MIKNFNDIIKKAQEKGPITVAVAVAQDEDVLKAVKNAFELGIVHPILVGDKKEIEKIGEKSNIDVSKFKIIDIEDNVQACKEAAKTVQRGEASILMKGFVDTSLILKAVLDKEIGLVQGGLLSHVGVLGVQGFDRLFVVSDSAMNIAPDVEQKISIIDNSLVVAKALGNDIPKVAMLCAVEKVNKKMPATLDAAEIAKRNEEGKIKNCIIGGPFALDNAVSEEAAKHKNITHPVAGKADILIAPDIEAGNILNKSMEYFGKAKKAGIIMGAKIPIVLTSRASSEESKLNSIALAALVSENKK